MNMNGPKDYRPQLRVLQDFGVELFQGYHFARPAFQAIASVAAEAYEPPPAG
jgi:EAL domain-containing protein (putative c-di-GMP-specific phosphodiesterase class I)